MNADMEFGSVRDMLGRVFGGGIGPIVGLLALVFLGYNSFQIIGAGERGVVFSTFGGVQEGVRGEGLQFKVPFIPIDVRIHKAETDASASSKDLQTVQSRIALNYHIAPSEASKIYQEVGTLYKERLIQGEADRSFGSGGSEGGDGPIHCGRVDHAACRCFRVDQGDAVRPACAA